MSLSGFELFFGKELKAKFQTNKVISRMLDVAQKATVKQAAWIRIAAKKSMRRKDGPSAPGQPPNAHNCLLRDFIFFDFDNNGASVVVGPALLQSKSGRRFDQWRGVSRTSIPLLLEEGGPVQVFKKNPNDPRGGHYYSDQLKARPYMAPAFERSKNKLPTFWEQARMGT